MVEIAQNLVVPGAGGPQEEMTSWKKKVLDSNMETYWEQISVLQFFLNKQACQGDRRQIAFRNQRQLHGTSPISQTQVVV